MHKERLLFFSFCREKLARKRLCTEKKNISRAKAQRREALPRFLRVFLRLAFAREPVRHSSTFVRVTAWRKSGERFFTHSIESFPNGAGPGSLKSPTNPQIIRWNVRCT
jgi:hypothetical protein